jgi:ABC-type glycerol-3-phosphate transport system permease component
MTPHHPTSPLPHRLRSLLLHLLLTLAAAIVVVPFLWLVLSTFKPAEDFSSNSFFPTHVTLSNFRRALADEPLLTWLFNSLFLASAQTVLVIVLSSLAGFALAKYNFRLKRPIMLLMLGTLMLPWIILMPGSYRLIRALGWIDTYRAILLPGAVSVFGTLLYRQAMLGVSDELLAAARIDGCSELGLWWHIAMPIVRPMTAAFTLLSFLGSWNSFLWPQVILQDEARYTLPIGLANMLAMGQYQRPGGMGILLAATVLAILPPMVLFFLLQRDFVAGISAGAIKA